MVPSIRTLEAIHTVDEIQGGPGPIGPDDRRYSFAILFVCRRPQQISYLHMPHTVPGSDHMHPRSLGDALFVRW
jgi:hypothetical protein